MKKSINFLTINKYLFIIIFISLSILTSLFVLILSYFFNLEPSDRKSEDNIFLFFLKAIVIAPFIETFIFQFIPIETLKRFIKKDVTILVLSGLFFGFAHFFKNFLIRDIIMTSFLGFIFAYSYILAKNRNDMNAFFSVSLIHLGYNLFILILKL